jgi:hypothetical protein
VEEELPLGVPVGEAGEVWRWEALIGLPSGIEHADAVVDGTPEDAVRAAMARAVEKHGPQGWERWRFRAERCSQPPVASTVYFEWRDGVLVRLENGQHGGFFT